MISWLKGTLLEKTTGEVTINVEGVGYHVFIPLSTYYALPEIGEELSLNIHTHVREDLISLYGFSERTERNWFRHLIRVSGIGPRLAINILSGISVDDLRNALASSDASRLQAIPGIGKKMAARMTVELKELTPSLDGPSIAPEGPGLTNGLSPSIFMDAVSALVNLGFNPQVSSKTVREIVAGQGDISLKDVIKQSLKALQR
jgi:Holliday junction DNA helicase RuvA